MPLREIIAAIRKGTITEVDLSNEWKYIENKLYFACEGQIIPTRPFAVSMSALDKPKRELLPSETQAEYSKRQAESVEDYLKRKDDILECTNVLPHPSGQMVVCFQRATLMFDPKTQKYTSLVHKYFPEEIKANYHSPHALSPDGSFLVQSSNGRRIDVLGLEAKGIVEKGKVQPLGSHDADLAKLELCSGETPLLASVDRTGCTKVWSIKEPRCLAVLQEETKQQVVFVKFIENGTQLLTATREGIIRFWDVKNGKCLETLKHEQPKSLFSKPDPNYQVIYELMPDGRLLSLACGIKVSESIKVWDLEKAKLCKTFPMEEAITPNSPKFSVDGHLLVVTQQLKKYKKIQCSESVAQSFDVDHPQSTVRSLDLASGQCESLAIRWGEIYVTSTLADGELLIYSPLVDETGKVIPLPDDRVYEYEVFNPSTRKSTTFIRTQLKANRLFFQAEGSNGTFILRSSSALVSHKVHTKALASDDLRFLFQVLTENSSVVSLKLPSTIDDQVIPTLVNCLRKNKTLTKIDARNSNLTEKGAAAILKAIEHRVPKLELCYGANITVVSKGVIRDEKALLATETSPGKDKNKDKETKEPPVDIKSAMRIDLTFSNPYSELSKRGEFEGVVNCIFIKKIPGEGFLSSFSKDEYYIKADFFHEVALAYMDLSQETGLVIFDEDKSTFMWMYKVFAAYMNRYPRLAFNKRSFLIEESQEIKIQKEIAELRKYYENKGRTLASYQGAIKRWQCQRHHEAAESLLKITTIDPYNKYAFNFLGVICVERGEWDKAISYFERALAIDPDYFYAVYNRTIALVFQNSSLDKTRRHLENIIVRTQEHYSVDSPEIISCAKAGLGLVYYDRDREQSEQNFREASSSLAALEIQFIGLVALRAYDQALKLFNLHLLKLHFSPSYPTKHLLIHKAFAHIKLGEEKETREILKVVLLQDKPNSELIQSLMKRVMSANSCAELFKIVEAVAAQKHLEANILRVSAIVARAPAKATHVGSVTNSMMAPASAPITPRPVLPSPQISLAVTPSSPAPSSPVLSPPPVKAVAVEIKTAPVVSPIPAPTPSAPIATSAPSLAVMPSAPPPQVSAVRPVAPPAPAVAAPNPAPTPIPSVDQKAIPRVLSSPPIATPAPVPQIPSAPTIGNDPAGPKTS